MAISIAANTVYSLSNKEPSVPASLSFSRSSSWQIPAQLRRFGIRYRGLKSKSHPRTLHLVEAKKQTFSSFDELLAGSDKPVFVEFYATWCGPCQFMVPILNEISVSMQDKILVVKIDTEKYPVIADKYNIQALPTFILFRDGKPCDRFEGALTADRLIERIEASLKVKQ